MCPQPEGNPGDNLQSFGTVDNMDSLYPQMGQTCCIKCSIKSCQVYPLMGSGFKRKGYGVVLFLAWGIPLSEMKDTLQTKSWHETYLWFHQQACHMSQNSTASSLLFHLSASILHMAFGCNYINKVDITLNWCKELKFACSSVGSLITNSMTSSISFVLGYM